MIWEKPFCGALKSNWTIQLKCFFFIHIPKKYHKPKTKRKKISLLEQIVHTHTKGIHKNIFAIKKIVEEDHRECKMSTYALESNRRKVVVWLKRRWFGCRRWHRCMGECFAVTCFSGNQEKRTVLVFCLQIPFIYEGFSSFSFSFSISTSNLTPS